jgi:hypothetical protein
MEAQYGECVITLTDDLVNGTQLRVDRADPIVRISPQLLAGMLPPGAPWPATYDPETRVLRIDGINRTVIYRIRDILEPVPGWPGHWEYIGEWPD